MKKKVSIVVKLIGMSVLPVLLLGIILSVYGVNSLQNKLKSQINSGLESVAITIEGSYDAAGEGDFVQLESGNVIKGMTVVSGNYDLYDSIKKNSQTDTALFYGDKLVVTSLTDKDGKHITDLSVSDDVKKQVLSEGKTYFSQNVDINGETYFGYYLPVKNENGSIGAMIFAGKDAKSIKSQIAAEGFKMAGISAVLVIVASVFTGMMAMAIARAIKQTVGMLGKVSDGDLRDDGKNIKAAGRSDEIGDMAGEIKSLRSSLRNIIGNIHATSEHLTESAGHMEASAKTMEETSLDMGTAVHEISNGAASQAQDTADAMGSIDNMGQLIEQMVDDIGVLAGQSEEIRTTSQSVSDIIIELSAYTEKTTSVINEISHQTEVTNESAHKIQAAVEIIQSIAEETNLLSLNASIEAARAGENGKGFAVVAAQIQKLAEQSNQSAQQIEKVIATLLADSEKSVNTMKEVVDIVGTQDEKLSETKREFIIVNDQIGQSLERIDMVRDKSKIIDDARTSIMEVITNLSAISEENASVAEQTADSSENLSKVVESMTTEAVKLKELAEQLEKQIDSFIVE
ncbi:methyl-accepting chemotaxis protein [Agathobacter sp.]